MTKFLLNFLIISAQVAFFTEYYLLDTLGSFLFLKKGEPAWLLVKDENAMETLQRNAKEHSKQISPPTLKAISNFEVILHSFTDSAVAPAEWEHHLYPANNSKGEWIIIILS